MNGRLVAEVEPSGALRSHFVYASQGHSPDYMIRAGQLYYFTKDNLGSIKAVIDASSGTVAQAIHYDEFGRVLVNTNPGFQPFGFAGGHFDHETGLVRFGARDYDPEVGRWLSKDPILFSGGQGNLYSAVMNDPVNNIDPSGLYLVTSGDWRGQVQIWKAIANLRKTCEGEELYQLLNNSEKIFTLRLRDEFEDFDLATGSRFRPSTNEVIVDPRDVGRRIPGSRPAGGTFSLERILAHELGHAAGKKDGGVGKMSNVNRWENPIMRRLDGYSRTKY